MTSVNTRLAFRIPSHKQPFAILSGQKKKSNNNNNNYVLLLDLLDNRLSIVRTN